MASRIANAYSDTPVDKSLADVQKLLRGAGAKSITVDYNEMGDPLSLHFTADTKHGPQTYSLPANVEGCLKALVTDANANRLDRRRATRPQAARTAWKNLYDWTRIQLSMIAAGQVEMSEVLMPYLLFHNGGGGEERTLYQLMDAAGFNPRRALPLLGDS